MKPFVLVVDDDLDTLALVHYLLRKDFDVVTASGGATALILLKSFCPNVIVTDLMMPILDGLSFIKTVKDLEACKNIPIIILSGYVEGYHKEVIDVGATLVLSKPEGTLLLPDKVKQVLAINEK